MLTLLSFLAVDPHTKILYILALIALAMILDFLSGLLAIKLNKKLQFSAKLGINGILKKIATFILLLFFIPLAPVVPGNTGIGLLYIMYLGYLFMEVRSIIENYQKMGIDIESFLSFLKKANATSRINPEDVDNEFTSNAMVDLKKAKDLKKTHKD